MIGLHLVVKEQYLLKELIILTDKQIFDNSDNKS